LSVDEKPEEAISLGQMSCIRVQVDVYDICIQYSMILGLLRFFQPPVMGRKDSGG
jgi:hypothetical protein